MQPTQKTSSSSDSTISSLAAQVAELTKMNKPQPVASVCSAPPLPFCNFYGEAHRTIDCQATESPVAVELVDYVNHQIQQGGGPFTPNPARGYQNHPAYSWDANRRPYDQQPHDQNQRYSAQSSQPQHQQQSQSANPYSQPSNNY
ncbi:hypothetical protein M5689_000753 [Euphorbia peplus]|nr:hypothetical protein M5689_000753 [Euphorbia peplus]